MPLGPVPSDCLHLLDGEFLADGQDAGDYIAQNGHRLSVSKDPGIDRLDSDALATLNSVFDLYGDMARRAWSLVNATHEFPEYKEMYRDGTSTIIPYEVILKHHGGEQALLHERPVISQSTATHMVTPFWGSDSDL